MLERDMMGHGYITVYYSTIRHFDALPGLPRGKGWEFIQEAFKRAGFTWTFQNYNDGNSFSVYGDGPLFQGDTPEKPDGHVLIGEYNDHKCRHFRRMVITNDGDISVREANPQARDEWWNRPPETAKPEHKRSLLDRMKEVLC